MKDFLFVVGFSLIFNNLFAQAPSDDFDLLVMPSALEELSLELKEKEEQMSATVHKLAKEKGWKLRYESGDGTVYQLRSVDAEGNPVYIQTFNAVSTQNIKATSMYSGGELNLGMNGSSDVMSGKIAVWDEGSVFPTHQDFQKSGVSKIEVKDNASPNKHSTHVGGTISAYGYHTPAKGMAWGLQKLYSYDWNSDLSELATAANTGLLLSNHSYGNLAGWANNGSSWYWYGIDGQKEDYKFGLYSDESRDFDRISYLAPSLLSVFAAGNQHAGGLWTARNSGPSVYGNYSVKVNGFDVLRTRATGMSSQNSYDNLLSQGCSKNGLTVGAIYGIDTSVPDVSSSTVAGFSSWGGTDDGRIKPDVVARGVDVTSTVFDTNNPNSVNLYEKLNGTSMATPSVTGGLALLQEYYYSQYRCFLKGATLKALAIHTAEDLGNDGPDYIYGWGLLNVENAAKVIQKKMFQESWIYETSLSNQKAKNYDLLTSNNDDLKITICWTDVAGAAGTTLLNNRTSQLVNDLDVVLIDYNNPNDVIYPYKLDVDHPNNTAIRGVNSLDNVEQIYLRNSLPSKHYVLTISHKGTLSNSTQNFSLIVTGFSTATLSLSSIIDNQKIICGGVSEKLKVSYNNTQNYTITTLTCTVNLSYNNVSTVSTQIIETFIPIKQLSSFFVDLDLRSLSTNNSIKCNVTVTVQNGIYSDTETITLDIIPSPKVANQDGKFCATNKIYTFTTNPLSINMHPEAYQTTYWYENETNAVPIFVGRNIVLENQESNKYPYIYSGINTFSGTIGLRKEEIQNGDFSTTVQIMSFYTNSPIIIRSANIYTNNSGTIQIIVFNASQIVSSIFLSVLPNVSTYSLNLNIPNSGSYSISIIPIGNVSLFKGSRSQMPLNIGNAVSIHNFNGVENEYAYLFNLNFQSLGCISSEKNQITISTKNEENLKIIHTLSKNIGEYIQLSSDANTPVDWQIAKSSLLGGIVVCSNTLYFVPSKTENYRAYLVSNDGCPLYSNIFSYTTPIKMEFYGLSIFPNPSQKEISLSYALQRLGNLKVRIYNNIGQLLHDSGEQEITERQGYYNFSMPDNAPSGIYLVKIETPYESYKSNLLFLP